MNKHLNIFNFFNGSNIDYLEDNLSRAFALCLKYDRVFLEKVLKSVLSPNVYSNIFNTQLTDCKIEIDLQNRVNELKDFDAIIGVACSGIEITDFENIDARETDSPETDVCIFVNNICILFEFKKTSEDCAAQLKCQVEKVKRNCPKTATTEYKDLSWNKIIKIILDISLQKQAENPFTSDFVKFLENFPHWFPTRLMQNIPFPKDESDPNYYYLDSRLNQIKKQIYGEENTKEYIGRFNRLTVEVDFGWINEINIGPTCENGEDFIAIWIHIGDTKTQGQKFFTKKPNGVDWQSDILGFRLEAEPYIKFSDMYASGLLWLRPNLEESRNTHNLNFFHTFAGRCKRENWREFENELNNYVADWKDKCSIPNTKNKASWDDKFENTQRTGFLLSVGTLLTVFISYKECQQLDEAEFNPQLIDKFRKIINEIKQTVDGIEGNSTVLKTLL